MRVLSSFALIALPVTDLFAQGVCRPDDDQREAKLLAFYTGPLTFSPSGNINSLGLGQIRLGFEATYVPEPNAEISRPERCYASNKSEDTRLSPVFPRPRVALGLGGGWVVEGSYLPPVTVFDATPNLASVALSRLTSIGPAGLLLRAHATFGKVEGAITCSEDALQLNNVNDPCYGSEKSEDTYKPNMFGGEAAITFVVGSRTNAYAGAGYTSLRPRFQVGFQDGRAGVPYDDTRIEGDLSRVSLFGGAVFQVSPLIGFTAELYSVPEDVTTFRVGASYRLR
ncbi:MAG: hypothetical protein ACREVJ_09900 [Gammaproteobacteria bacterium]